jgi:hypothetical protein
VTSARALTTVAGATLLASLAVPAGVAGAQAARSGGPGISVERTALRPGDRVVVTLSGWRSSLVTLSVCGNLAKRGSADCNLSGGQSVTIATNQAATLTELRVTSPPGTCPCVIRASSTTQGEVALARVELAGVPVGPVVDPRGTPPVDVTVAARRSHAGSVAALRSALGGPTRYRVNVRVRNRTEAALANLAVTGSAGRGRTDELSTFRLPSPGVLQPDELWEHEALVTLPAPAIGSYSIRVLVSGAGPPVSSEALVRRLPMVLLAAAVILVLDLAAMAWRVRSRRRRGAAPHAVPGLLPQLLAPTGPTTQLAPPLPPPGRAGRRAGRGGGAAVPGGARATGNPRRARSRCDANPLPVRGAGAAGVRTRRARRR